MNQGKAKQWQTTIKRWKKSGLSITRWCKQEGISRPSFFYWGRKLGELPFSTRKRSSPSGPAGFIELERETRSGIELSFGEIKIHLEEDFNKNTLKRLLEVAKEARC